MRAPILLFVACSLLSGCGTIKSLFAFDGAPAEPATITAVSQPAAAVIQPDEAWCQRIAASDRARAQQSGFDTATLDRMALQSYQQCRTLAAR